jgi:hypothetical protein
MTDHTYAEQVLPIEAVRLKMRKLAAHSIGTDESPIYQEIDAHLTEMVKVANRRAQVKPTGDAARKIRRNAIKSLRLTHFTDKSERAAATRIVKAAAALSLSKPSPESEPGRTLYRVLELWNGRFPSYATIRRYIKQQRTGA